jgi:hypothetical protein
MPALSNFTAPADWTDHGIPGLVCQPATWSSIAGFFISNFVAHALTLKQDPGQTTAVTVFATLTALCFPTYGIGKATGSLITSARLPFRSGDDALRRAQKAGALCMVVRAQSWRPAVDDEIRNATRSDILVCATILGSDWRA